MTVRSGNQGSFMQRQVWMQRLRRIWSNQSGALKFEWILVSTLMVFGVIAATATLRDSLLNELNDISGAILSINQSMTVQPSPPINGMPAQNNGFTVVDSSKNRI
jgi:Flp pilus assembly pilin Flp